jgi:hypothetical protein
MSREPTSLSSVAPKGNSTTFIGFLTTETLPVASLWLNL